MFVLPLPTTGRVSFRLIAILSLPLSLLLRLDLVFTISRNLPNRIGHGFQGEWVSFGIHFSQLQAPAIPGAAQRCLF